MLEAAIRHAREDDYLAIARALQGWWTQSGFTEAGARERAALAPRLWLQHFSTTSLIAERKGKLDGFLIGFLSQDRMAEGYIHFGGVAPDARRQGLGRTLYHCFFELWRAAGRSRVELRHVTAERSFHHLPPGVGVRGDTGGAGTRSRLRQRGL